MSEQISDDELALRLRLLADRLSESVGETRDLVIESHYLASQLAQRKEPE